MLAVSNTTPLIYLAKAKLLKILQNSFDEIYIPEEVYQEAVPKGVAAGYQDAIDIQEACSSWLQRKSVRLNLRVAFLRTSLTGADLQWIRNRVTQMHKADATVITLAIELGADKLIMDDKASLKVSVMLANHFHFDVVGTGDLVDEALKTDIISQEEHDCFVTEFSDIATWIAKI